MEGEKSCSPMDPHQNQQWSGQWPTQPMVAQPQQGPRPMMMPYQHPVPGYPIPWGGPNFSFNNQLPTVQPNQKPPYTLPAMEPQPRVQPVLHELQPVKTLNEKSNKTDKDGSAKSTNITSKGKLSGALKRKSTGDENLSGESESAENKKVFNMDDLNKVSRDTREMIQTSYTFSLIDTVKVHLDDMKLAKNNTDRSYIWETIRGDLLKQGYRFANFQTVRTKFNGLKSKYRERKAELNKSGAGVSDPPYWWDALDDIMGNEPTINPIALNGAGVSNVTVTPTDKEGRMPRRQKASPTLKFLEEMEIKRAKTESEKAEAKKNRAEEKEKSKQARHNEKMELLRMFLSRDIPK